MVRIKLASAPHDTLEHCERHFGVARRTGFLDRSNSATQEIYRASEVRVKRELDNLVVQMYASGITYEEAIREFRRRYIQEVLAHNKGNQCKAARELGVHRNTLSRIMADLELDPAQIKLGLKRPARSERAVFPPSQMIGSK